MTAAASAYRCIAYNREWRERHPGYIAARKRPGMGARRRQGERADPVKHRAHQAVYRAVKSGRVVRPETCAECGARTKVQAHHDDYARRLEIVWLCQTCHQRRHFEEVAA